MGGGRRGLPLLLRGEYTPERARGDELDSMAVSDTIPLEWMAMGALRLLMLPDRSCGAWRGGVNKSAVRFGDCPRPRPSIACPMGVFSTLGVTLPGVLSNSEVS